jgi:hypothetical protein
MAKSNAELEAQIAELTARLAEATKPRAITYKVSEKGALSVYGVHSKFPVTLYAEQWERLDSDGERAKRQAFIAANTKLTRKGAA